MSDPTPRTTSGVIETIEPTGVVFVREDRSNKLGFIENTTPIETTTRLRPGMHLSMSVWDEGNVMVVPLKLPRPILDPEKAACGLWPQASVRLAPERIRAFGYIPNEDAMLPGDVILVTSGSVVGSLIHRAQSTGGFASDHAIWTHAAMYIGRGQVVEATPIGGVRVGNFLEMTYGRKVLVRRRSNDSLTTLVVRYQIAVEALTALRTSYSFSAIPRLAWLAMRQKIWKTDHRPNIESVMICSTFVRNAYARAARLDPLPQITGMIWPADLSQTDELTDQEIDFQAALVYYTGPLGFRPLFVYGAPPFYAHIIRDEAILALRHVDNPVIDRTAGVDLLSAFIEVSDANTLHASLQANGTPFHQAPRDEPWGMRSFIETAKGAPPSPPSRAVSIFEQVLEDLARFLSHLNSILGLRHQVEHGDEHPNG
eukprot:gene5526-5580_t